MELVVQMSVLGDFVHTQNHIWVALYKSEDLAIPAALLHGSDRAEPRAEVLVVLSEGARARICGCPTQFIPSIRTHLLVPLGVGLATPEI